MNPMKKVVVAGALMASTLTGGAVGAMLVNGSASAQTGTSTTQPAASGATPSAPGAPGSGGRAFDPTRGGHIGSNGVTEALLTGDTAAKVKAAALAAVPGGTIERVENDAEGSPYEAHMTRADGTRVTVKVDASFKVTSTEEGPR